LRATGAGCCAWALLQAASVQSATLELELGAEHSDNVARVQTDEQSDTIGTARVAAGLNESRPRLEAHLSADLEYRHYFDDTFRNEVLGGVDGDLQWKILPERFIWVVEDNYGQIARTRLAVDTPDNRQDFNYFTTGPDLSIPLGARTTGVLSGRWSDVYYEASDEDSENVEGTAGLARRLSEETTLSLLGSVKNIEYDDELLQDYRITDGFLRLASLGDRTTLEVDAGYTEAKRGEQTSDGPLVRLDITRQITSRSSVRLHAGSVFSDTAGALRLDQSSRGVATEIEDGIAATDVFRDTYAYLDLQTERERTTFAVGAYGRRERHEQQLEFDRDVVGATLGWTRRLSSRLDLSVNALYSDEKFVEDDVSFQEWSVGAGVGVRLSPAVSMHLSAAHYDGSGRDIERNYEENRAYFSIRYSVGQRGR
jgi:hypothetical protein